MGVTVLLGTYVRSTGDVLFDPSLPFSDRGTIKVQTDVGGFGFGMELTWIAFGALEYRFSDGLAVWFGYQGLGQDFDDTGDREVLSMDVTYHGPVRGLAMSW